jgi:DNA-binding winged helix-turn-helix (wHTH) protein
MDPVKQILSHGGITTLLTPGVFNSLHVLVQRRGRLAENKDLIDAVWQGSLVEDAKVCVTMSRIRRALKSEEHIALFATIPGLDGTIGSRGLLKGNRRRHRACGALPADGQSGKRSY